MRLKTVLLVVLALAFTPLALTAEETLTNQDVVKMSAAGLGDDLIIAKVREAPRVEFALEVDDLVSLRQAGVSERVVQAMLERKAGSPWPATAAPTQMGNPADPWQSAQEDLGFALVKVALRSSEGTVPISILRGEMSSAGFMGWGNTFMNYPGLKAKIRTHDRRPSLLVKSSAPLTGGRYFLARLDPDQDDEVRSLKISSMGKGLKAAFAGGRGLMEPDPDWTIPFDSAEEGEGLWRVIVKQDLEPGEYGWYVDLATGAQGNGLFGFGVD